MEENNLTELRAKLNDMIENGANPEEILKVSIALDNLIEQHMMMLKQNLNEKNL